MNLEEQTKAATRLAIVYQRLQELAPTVEKFRGFIEEKSNLEAEAIAIVKAMKQPKPSKKPKESKPVVAVSAYTRKTRSDKGKARKGIPDTATSQIEASQSEIDPDQPIGEIIGQIKS